MYPEDFYEPTTDFSSLAKLIEFSRLHKISDIRGRARQLRETFRRYAVDGRFMGPHFS